MAAIFGFYGQTVTLFERACLKGGCPGDTRLATLFCQGQNWSEEVIEGGAEEGGARNRESPRPNDASGDSPADCSEAAGSADTDDSAGDGVRSTDGNAKMRRREKSQPTSGLCSKSAERSKFCNALAHCFDDAPAASHRAATHGEVAHDNHPVGHVVTLEQTTCDQRGSYDAHAFLRVVRAMPQTIRGCGE